MYVCMYVPPGKRAAA